LQSAAQPTPRFARKRAYGNGDGGDDDGGDGDDDYPGRKRTHYVRDDDALEVRRSCGHRTYIIRLAKSTRLVAGA
jgi:hypothetical protein